MPDPISQGSKSRAERDGESFVVNGQKVWTSGAQHSDWAILIARTNPDVPKHKGITYFLVDMHSPGVEVRPLRQITGQCPLQRGLSDGCCDSRRERGGGDQRRMGRGSYHHEL